MAVTRFSVSLESELLDALDEYVLQNKYPNRSQAIRMLIEKNIVEHKWKCNNIVAGAVVLIFKFNKTDIQSKLAEVLFQHTDIVLSAQHFYLSTERILEIIAVKGESRILTEFSENLISIKGIEHGKLIMSKLD